MMLRCNCSGFRILQGHKTWLLLSWVKSLLILYLFDHEDEIINALKAKIERMTQLYRRKRQGQTYRMSLLPIFSRMSAFSSSDWQGMMFFCSRSSLVGRLLRKRAKLSCRATLAARESAGGKNETELQSASMTSAWTFHQVHRVYKCALNARKSRGLTSLNFNLHSLLFFPGYLLLL